MVVLHIAGLTNNKFGGPNINVPMNVLYENKKIESGMYDCKGNNLDNILPQDINFFSINEYPNIKSLPTPFNNPDLIIFESMYIKNFIKIYKEIEKIKIPYVIVPRGSMTKSAQHKKMYKKIVGNILIFNKWISHAKSIHYLTENEYIESKCFKIRDYFIVGNGVEAPNNIKDFSSNNFERFIVTFIGRIEKYHKGLDVLFDAINIIKNEIREKNVVFNFYGMDKENSVEYLNRIAQKYGIIDLINFNKPISGEEKEKVLLNTDLFIHTSRLEGQPTAVIEAISYGIPVFVTPGTNLYDEVKNNKLGFVTQCNAKDIATNLIKVINSTTLFDDISKREIEYAKHNFQWDIIANKDINYYKKIISKT